RQPDAATDETEAARYLYEAYPALREPGAGIAGGEGIEAVEHRSDDHEADSQKQELVQIVPVGRDELRDECPEDEEHLGVRQDDDEALQEEAAFGTRSRSRQKLTLRANELDAEPDEIGRTRDPDNIEPHAHQSDRRSEPQNGDRHPQNKAGLGAQHIEKTGTLPVFEAIGDDHRDGRPGHDDNGDGGKAEGDIGFDGHGALLMRKGISKP